MRRVAFLAFLAAPPLVVAAWACGGSNDAPADGADAAGSGDAARPSSDARSPGSPGTDARATPPVNADGAPPVNADGGPTPPTDAAIPDDGGNAAAPLPTTWLSSTTLYEDASMVALKIQYLSDGLKVFGQICYPKSAGVHPVSIVNHGGFAGFGVDTVGATCKQAGTQDYVVVQASYRGEDGSEGSVEVCLGEVDDVLAITSIALAQPFSDKTRVAMSGLSHGGCITLRALERGAPVQLAYEVAGPTDPAADFAMWQAALDAGTDSGSPGETYPYLISLVEAATGGTPETVPLEYQRRSPLYYAKDMAAYTHPLLLQHGTADDVVLPSDTCRMAAAVSGTVLFRVAADGGVDTTPIPGCEGTPALATEPRDPKWPNRTYAGFYDGVGHAVPTGPGFEDELTFLTARFP